MKTLSVLLLFSGLCGAAERPAEIAALVDAARGAPAEFAADTIIRVANFTALDKAWRIELLEEAFRYGGGARQPFRRHAAQVKQQSLATLVERVSNQELDALSLQMRAINTLLDLDPVKARELFLQVATPQPPKLTCASPVTYDVSRYYAVLSRIAAETFTPKQAAEEEPFKLLMQHASVTAPAQVGPMAKVIAGAKLSDSQFRALLNTYSASLREIRYDDRNFSGARRAGVELSGLIEAAKRRNVAPIGLLESYRAYLVHHLTGERCADSSEIGMQIVIESIATNYEKEVAASNPAGYFNESLRIDPVPALTGAEQTPSKSEGRPVGLGVCASTECADISKQLSALMFKPGMLSYSMEEKAKDEWQEKLRQFLAAMVDWKQDTGATEAEHVRYKCSVYNELLAIVPPGKAREQVLRGTLEYLEVARSTAIDPAEWFLPANTLLARVALEPVALEALGKLLMGSRDPVIALYARLERIAPRSADRIAPLL